MLLFLFQSESGSPCSATTCAPHFETVFALAVKPANRLASESSEFGDDYSCLVLVSALAIGIADFAGSSERKTDLHSPSLAINLLPAMEWYLNLEVDKTLHSAQTGLRSR